MASCDEEDIKDLTVAEGLDDLIDGRDDQEAGKEDAEDCKCCAVEYTEERDMHSFKCIMTGQMSTVEPMEVLNDFGKRAQTSNWFSCPHTRMP